MTYIRGQNICIEPEELLERERKRQKAKDLQNAIRQQLEERDRKRKEEREKRQKEERLEEERLRKQQEMERKRLEEERRKQREKEVKEERKEKAMKEALELAERLAREDKIKTRLKHKPELSTTKTPSDEETKNNLCIAGSELNTSRVEYEEESKANEIDKEDKVQNDDNTKDNNEKTTTHPEDEKPPDKELRNLRHTSNNTNTQSANDLKPSSLEEKKEEGPDSSEEPDLEPDSLDEDGPDLLVLAPPTTTTTTEVEVEASQLSLVVSPGRLLTPRKFRNNPSYEKSTQTDVKLDISSKAPQGLRGRSQQRSEERPKWGVNRPETQYIKQSERDPYYQTRLRRNLLRVRTKPGKLEREDSRSPSPVNMKIQGSQAPVTMVTRGTITPRVMQMVLPSHTITDGRSRYLAFKGGVGAVVASNVFRHKPELKPIHPPVEMSLVKDVLNQLTSLRQGLTMKQQEWDVSRSQTPYSEISSLSTSA